MRQYLDLLKEIKERGTHKPPAREGMPGSTSLFGYQFRHNLQRGFPLLTTKKMYWKGIVTELLWMLNGDTNIKYLLDNGVNIWNEDAYNYYLKHVKEVNWKEGTDNLKPFSFEGFLAFVKLWTEADRNKYGYLLGDCGYQYGQVWRNYGPSYPEYPNGDHKGEKVWVDQIATVINSLKNHPESRRHIVTAIDPCHDNQLALYWCHALFQFNCRPLTFNQRMDWTMMNSPGWIFDTSKIKEGTTWEDLNDITISQEGKESKLEFSKAPKYYLDCHMYQRSADVFLGVPFNIASYALLTHIIAKVCNMIPGHLIISYGDVHIYDNHMEAVDEQLKRVPDMLPNLVMNSGEPIWRGVDSTTYDLSFEAFIPEDFKMVDYYPQPAIKAELSTGLKK